MHFLRVNVTFYGAVNIIHDVIISPYPFPYTAKFMFVGVKGGPSDLATKILQKILKNHPFLWRRMSGGTTFLFGFEKTFCRQPYCLLGPSFVRHKTSSLQACSSRLA